MSSDTSRLPRRHGVGAVETDGPVVPHRDDPGAGRIGATAKDVLFVGDGFCEPIECDLVGSCGRAPSQTVPSRSRSPRAICRRGRYLPFGSKRKVDDRRLITFIVGVQGPKASDGGRKRLTDQPAATTS